MKKVLSIWFCYIILSLMVMSSAQAFKFAVISDTRVGSLDNALEFIVSQQVDFMVLPGDYYPYFVEFGFEVLPENQPDEQGVYFSDIDN